MAAVRKSIHRLIDLRETLPGCHRRYLDFLSALDDFSAGSRRLDPLTASKAVDGHRIKGFNGFDKTGPAWRCSLQRPPFNIRSIRRADRNPFLPNLSVASLTRYLKRRRDFKRIKKAANSCRYDLTRPGRNVIAAAGRISEQIIVPALAA